MLLQNILCGTFVPPAVSNTRTHRILVEPVRAKTPKPKITPKPTQKNASSESKTSLPPGSERLLSALHTEEWQSITALAAKLGVTSSAVHQYLRPLYDKELIVRKVVSGKGNIRYRYVKLRTEAENREVVSDVKDKQKALDKKVVRFLSGTWKTRKQICRSIDIPVDILDQSMRRISKEHKVDKERVRINTIKTMRYRIGAAIK